MTIVNFRCIRGDSGGGQGRRRQEGGCRGRARGRAGEVHQGRLRAQAQLLAAEGTVHLDISTISRSRYLNKHLQYLGHGAAGLHLLVPQQDDGELQPRPGQGGGHAPGRHGIHTHGQFRGLNIYILYSADL